MRSCASCGVVWTARSRRADAKFCSDRCRQRGQRARKASGETAARKAPGAPWTASAAFGPGHTGRTPDEAPRAAVRDASGKVIDVRALIG